jgi:hypothetical protein
MLLKQKLVIAVLIQSFCGAVHPSGEQQAGHIKSDVLSADKLMQTIVEYDAMGIHRSESPGDRDTADWIASRLQFLGYRVSRQPFALPLYKPTLTQIKIDNLEIEAFPQWPKRWNGSKGLEGTLRIFSPENPELVKQHIALIDLPFRRHSTFLRRDIVEPVNAAIDAGALAVIQIPHGPTAGITALNVDGNAAPLKVPVMQVAVGDRGALISAISSAKWLNLFSTGQGPSQALAGSVIARLDRGPRWFNDKQIKGTDSVHK